MQLVGAFLPAVRLLPFSAFLASASGHGVPLTSAALTAAAVCHVVSLSAFLACCWQVSGVIGACYATMAMGNRRDILPGRCLRCCCASMYILLALSGWHLPLPMPCRCGGQQVLQQGPVSMNVWNTT